MSQISMLLSLFTRMSLVLRIALGILFGTLLATVAPEAARSIGFLGALFVGALKAVAPILVFVLVAASIVNQKAGQHTNMKPVISLYLLGTLAAALVAVLMSFLFPTTLTLTTQTTSATPPEGIGEVLNTLLFKMVQNPVEALLTGNFIGILVWALGLGMLLRKASDSTKNLMHDLSSAISSMVHRVIQLAPIGIFGLVANTVALTGFEALASYGQLLAVLVGSMLIISLVVNPAIVFWKTRENPYPLVLRCIRESGVTAFFTRSSAANIPVNMELCKDLKLHEDTYSVSIPLGATVNMGGAAITISVMTLAAAHTLGIQVDLLTALILCVVAAVSACGASGVAGGSLLLIPLACSLFGIPNDVAMQVVAVGFIIGVIQDSVETALNSSTDVVFTAAACIAAEKADIAANEVSA